MKKLGGVSLAGRPPAKATARDEFDVWEDIEGKDDKVTAHFY
jgi:hypothetical protein